MRYVVNYNNSPTDPKRSLPAHATAAEALETANMLLQQSLYVTDSDKDGLTIISLDRLKEIAAGER